MYRFIYAPELEVSTGGQLVTAKKVKKAKTYTPGSDDDFSVIADRINVSWKDNPDITLVWIKQPQFEEMCLTFSEDIEKRKMAGGERRPLTSDLRIMSTTMNMAVTEVKIYIEKKYKKVNAIPHFARFGITKTGSGAYELSRDYSKRLKALDLMIASIAKDGFGDEEYGTDFWTDMKARFATALTDASTTDGTVSNKVSAKNVMRQQMEKVMTALRAVLTGNYPDTYPAVFREWGWQKQDY